MNWGFLNIFKRARSMRGATSGEYALCCALLCVFVAGSIGNVSKGINSSFEALHDGHSIAAMSCGTCSYGGGGNGPGDGPESFTEGQPDDSGGGSVSTERPPSHINWQDEYVEPPPPPTPHIQNTPEPVLFNRELLERGR